MKIKLLKCHTEERSCGCSYCGDDWSDIAKHVVDEYTEWEEVDNDKLYQIQEFVKTFNQERMTARKWTPFFYVLIKKDEISNLVFKTFVEEMMERERVKKEQEAKEAAERKVKLEAQKAEREKKAALNKAKKDAKNIEKLRAQLAAAEEAAKLLDKDKKKK